MKSLFPWQKIFRLLQNHYRITSTSGYAYLKAGIVNDKWAPDALHVAIATVSGSSLVVSWNFKHMMNKRFECVKFMHQAAGRIYKETKGMSIDQELDYWRQKEFDRAYIPCDSPRFRRIVKKTR